MQQALDDAASVGSMVVNGPNGERAIINSVTKYDDQDKPTVQNINGHDEHAKVQPYRVGREDHPRPLEPRVTSSRSDTIGGLECCYN